MTNRPRFPTLEYTGPTAINKNVAPRLTSLQRDRPNHASTPPLSFFTGRMPFLPPNQQRQSTEGTTAWNNRFG